MSEDQVLFGVVKQFCRFGIRSNTQFFTPVYALHITPSPPPLLHKAGSLKMNTALEYSTRVVQEGGRRCKKSTLNDLVHLTPLRITLIVGSLKFGLLETATSYTYFVCAWYQLSCMRVDKIESFPQKYTSSHEFVAFPIFYLHLSSLPERYFYAAFI